MMPVVMSARRLAVGLAPVVVVVGLSACAEDSDVVPSGAVSRVPSWVGLAAVVLGCAVIAGAAVLVVRRVVPRERLEENLEAASAKFQGVATLYGILLALVVFAVWSNWHEAADSVTGEAEQAVLLDRLAASFPEPLRGELQGAIANYLEVVIDDEWQLEGGVSLAARGAMADIYAVVTGFVPPDDRLSNLQAQALDEVSALDQARIARVQNQDSALPSFLWVLLLLGAAVTIGFALTLVTPSPWSQAVMVAALAAVLAFSLYAVVALNEPFSRPFSLPPTPYRVALGAVQADP